MGKREEATEVEGWIKKWFSTLQFEIGRFYKEQTGMALPRELDDWQIKDLSDRWVMWRFFDREFMQDDLEAHVDGVASGAACELKYNTYGFNELDEVVIDYNKVSSMPDDGRIVFLYFNPNFGKRQFLVGDIKKYGKLSTRGGKKDNKACGDSSKLVYFVPHSVAESEFIYGD